jgi:hypothetical protein
MEGTIQATMMSSEGNDRLSHGQRGVAIFLYFQGIFRSFLYKNKLDETKLTVFSARPFSQNCDTGGIAGLMLNRPRPEDDAVIKLAATLEQGLIAFRIVPVEASNNAKISKGSDLERKGATPWTIAVSSNKWSGSGRTSFGRRPAGPMGGTWNSGRRRAVK